jgi:hypothetical protein
MSYKLINTGQQLTATSGISLTALQTSPIWISFWGRTEVMADTVRNLLRLLDSGSSKALSIELDRNDGAGQNRKVNVTDSDGAASHSETYGTSSGWTDTWKHFLAVYPSKSGDFDIYIDGDVVTTSVDSAGPAGNFVITQLWLTQHNAASTFYWAEVGLGNTTLTSDERDQLAGVRTYAGAPRAPKLISSCAHWYSLLSTDPSSGRTDQKDSGATLSVSGAASDASHPSGMVYTVGTSTRKPFITHYSRMGND